MIPLMRPEQKSTLETDLQMLEKLHELGDHTGARMIARRLLISHTLSSDEKQRIKKVIDATKKESMVLFVIVLTIVGFLLVYLYLQYAA
jgi:hypothetical protein